jgi:protein O-GlcNAc transferase
VVGPSRAARVRRALVAACLIVAIPVVWRVGAAAADLQRAMTTYRLGVEWARQNRLDEAAAAFRTTISLYPRMREAHERLARVEVQRGRIDEALGAYRLIITQYPFSHFGDLYREMGFIELRDGRLVEAQGNFLRAVTLDPSDWRAHELLGQVYQGQGDVQQADASFRRARELKRNTETRL